ncbi:hypothetical protein JXD38_08510 [candidate division WOR-3 bacterium]|nr:hypothetical protein [candidate division WOR-3 bacterium]
MPAGRPKKPKPLEAFLHNYAEVEKLLHLYDELVSERKHKLHAERRAALRNTLHLNQSDDIDAAQKFERGWKYYIIVNRSRGGDPALFTATGLSVLLRQAVASAVSCMDGFFHDKYKAVACDRVAAAIGCKGALGIWDALIPFRAVVSLERYERKGYWRRVLLEQYVDEQTLQAPSEVARVFKEIGVKSLWNNILQEMPNPLKAQFKDGALLSAAVQKITDRRNRIVHDADRSGSRTSPIRPGEVKQWVELVRAVVEAADRAITA